MIGTSLRRRGSRAGAASRCADDIRSRPATKWVATAFSLVVIGAVLSPIAENWRADPRDDFPLSYYPMFTLKRAETSSVTFVAGFDRRGNRSSIPHWVVGPGGMNQVRRQISRTVEAEDAGKLCRTVGSRVARRRDEPYTGIVTLQVVTDWYRLDGYLVGDKTPVAEQVHATCDVSRAGS
jgi:hypothetical protein